MNWYHHAACQSEDPESDRHQVGTNAEPSGEGPPDTDYSIPRQPTPNGAVAGPAG